jgi:endonuclease/exonuclease/phosphatase family metal-dependent hydrolase
MKKLKILTWNIYMLPLLVPRPGKKKRARGIVEELSKCDFDIILFQEAFLPASRDIIWKGLQSIYPYQYGPANNSLHFKSSSGVWVLSKMELQLLNTVEFKKSAYTDALVRKGGMLLQGNCNGVQYQVLNTHLQASRYRPLVRYTQLEQLKSELLSPYAQTGIPQIICGDMNISLKYTREYERMLQVLDAVDGKISGTEKVTYDGHRNLIARLLGTRRKFNFDYILIRDNGFEFTSVNRHVSILKSNGNELSDHYGLVAELQF